MSVVEHNRVIYVMNYVDNVNWPSTSAFIQLAVGINTADLKDVSAMYSFLRKVVHW